MRGTVKWFNTEKGYGFAIGEDGDYYVHNADVVPKGIKLTSGAHIEFQPGETEHGLRAYQVRIVRDGSGEEQTNEPERV